ncbi:MAG: DUF4340 domain-containing protein [bacterium]
MYRKNKTRILLIVLIVLAVVFAVVQYSKQKQGERTFKEYVTELDTSKISGIVIIPGIENEVQDRLKLYKEQGNWKVKQGEDEYNALDGRIKQMINALQELKTESIAGLDKSSWTEFEVTDSSGTRVQILYDGKVTQEIIVGKSKYIQNQAQQVRQPMQYNQPGGNMMSYVRLADDEKVYMVEGFLKTSFDPNINSYRDKTIIDSEPAQWSSLQFNYPGDSSFTLVKKNKHWLIDGREPVDSNMVSEYFNKINRISGSEFAGGPLGQASHTLTIKGNMPSPVQISAAPADTVHQYIVHSSMNKDAYFSGKKGRIFSRLFVSKSYFKPDNSEAGDE